jgi:non-ribosomal peptide synthase protein (TIGR01720 family)
LDHEGRNTVGSVETLSVTLDAEETHTLLVHAQRRYRAQMDELLLSALWSTFNAWTGAPCLAVMLEGHGREAQFEDVDLSRTVGWFTSLYPLYLESESDAGFDITVPRIKDEVRAAKRHGVDYGLLRYLSPRAEVRARLAALPEPEVIFVYLGQFNRPPSEELDWGVAVEASGRQRDPANARAQRFEIAAAIADQQLAVSWTFSRACHDAATIENLAGTFIARLRSLIDHCRSTGVDAEAADATEFSAASLSERDFARIKQQLTSRVG